MIKFLFKTKITGNFLAGSCDKFVIMSDSMIKFAKTAFLVLLFTVVPLIPKSHLIFSFPVLFVVVSAFFLNMTQPDYSAKDFKEPQAHDRSSILLIFVAGVLFFVLPIMDFAYLSQRPFSFDNPVCIIGMGMMIFGLAFRYWSIQVLGKFFTAMVEIQGDHKLVDRGPYRFIRHPSYTGAFIYAVGISIMFQSLIGLGFCFLGFLPVYFYRIYVEEQALIAELGQQYQHYQDKTWRLFPYLY